VGTKCKEITTISSKDKAEQQSSKKVKGKQLEKYYRNTGIKMGGANSCERCVYAR